MNFYSLFNEMGKRNIRNTNPEIVHISTHCSGLECSTDNSVNLSIYSDTTLSKIITTISLEFNNELKLFNPHSKTLNEYIGKGYGPLLYDIAIEYSTLNGKGLISSRAAGYLFKSPRDTSPAAEHVYKFYYENRDDVKKTLLNHIDYPEIDKEDILKSPHLFCVYSKPPVKINYLKKRNKLFYNDEINKVNNFTNIEIKRPYLISHDDYDLINYFIDSDEDLSNEYTPSRKYIVNKWNSIGRLRTSQEISERKKEIENLVYAYIRRFLQIKDNDNIKEKDINKYTWKELVKTVDYHGKSLF